MLNKRTTYRNDWKLPCILEHLLFDKRKAKKISEVLTSLNLKIKLYSDNSWFDIVKA